jgi:hypothetical protein
MSEVITQRELRNDSGEIMRRLDRGETFVVTRKWHPSRRTDSDATPPLRFPPTHRSGDIPQRPSRRR